MEYTIVEMGNSEDAHYNSKDFRELENIYIMADWRPIGGISIAMKEN